MRNICRWDVRFESGYINQGSAAARSRSPASILIEPGTHGFFLIGIGLAGFDLDLWDGYHGCFRPRPRQGIILEVG